MLAFTGAARPRSAGALRAAAEQLGCDIAAIEAVIDVEAAGFGFDHAGRPKMLFEPHIFWQNLSGAERDAAAQEDLAYPAWKPDYPPDSYPRLYKALQINEDAALNSCSWGLPQILGENHMPAGYTTPQTMVAAFCDGEDEQIAAMARFICAKGLNVYLQTQNWAAFARGYNGPAYARNAYDQKLAAAYARHAGNADSDVTPAAPGPVASSPTAPTGNAPSALQSLIAAVLAIVIRTLGQAFMRWLRSSKR
ncbi:N-acetylmuramidase family protein [Pseudorhodoplanes sinuspersici]|uniref:N-acetylmuramidase domain-containing protein n=1 Tax=Pseudorhodoplanes sinuspersici TaxID=1235591 RepID=A0A1W6ZX15_9HYPH|nr:N-acetylmuramidase family protein [Pseudorhodoplanes sinuspersici]ARQ01681.1 hypothetical protein CAK95_23165 [Pseudorhodoplanes sinuspersici]RKE73405.1 uncharacterized protein DUF3380 [Pseudorhodoplanes sinuspersici]